MGKLSFLPGGLLATAAQATAAGNRRIGSTRRKRRGKKRSSARKARSGKRKSTSRGKPRPGTKAWMAYIRTKRKKKR